jgi:hypothetical protein
MQGHLLVVSHSSTTTGLCYKKNINDSGQTFGRSVTMRITVDKVTGNEKDGMLIPRS